MRLIILLIYLVLFGLLVYFQISSISNPILSPQNPKNINNQLNEAETKVDKYNQTIEDIQNKTDAALKAIK